MSLRRSFLLCGAAAVAIGLPDGMAHAQTAPVLPTGATVTQGGAHISTGPSTVTVNQSTPRAVINWQGFSIAQGQTVTFAQPDSQAATLNRVTGNTPSVLAGTLNATGQVYLVNPNGLQITASGLVNTQGFVGSTLNITDDDFMAGRLRFSGTGGSAGVINSGSITTGAGLAALIGGQVSNEGSITAPLGRVALGAGEAATLDLTGDGFLQVALPGDATNAQGALVSSSGTIQAGQVELKAATVRSALREAVNMSGVVRATGISGGQGVIVLDGGDGGTTRVSGVLDASGPLLGGRIDITGQTTALEGATVSSTGDQRGGLVRIGGGFQGGAVQDPASAQAQAYVLRFGETPALAASAVTTVDAGSRIDVSSSAGDGGTAVLWSTESTTLRGLILGQGATSGGAVEVSSTGHLAHPALSGIQLGQDGRLLLDPKNLLIDNTPPGSDPTTGQGYADAPDGDDYLYSGDIADLMNAGTSVTLQANNDITWYNGLTVTPAGTAGDLTLSAGRDVYLEGAFNFGGANLTITGNDTVAHGIQPASVDGGAQGVSTDDAVITGANAVTITVESGSFAYDDIVTGEISANSITLANLSTDPATRILMRHDFSVPGAITLTGNLQLAESGFTLSASSINWTNESTARIKGSGTVKFIENGVLTRQGWLTGVDSDAIRLALGSDGSTTPAYTRFYGENDPDPIQVHLVSGDWYDDGTTVDDATSVLGAGSVILTGPGSGAAAGDYTVTVSADAGLTITSRHYFIDLRPVSESLHVAPVGITVNLTPTVSNGTYTYGSPTAVVHLSGIVGTDDVAPTASVTGLGAETLGAAGSGNFAFRNTLTAGSYSYTLTGLSGTTASNYVLDLTGVITANLIIAPKPITYIVLDSGHTYGDTPGLTPALDGVLGGDSVAGAVTISRGGITYTLDDHLGAGTYDTAVTSLTGSEAGNYVIDSTPFANTDGQYTVDPRALTFSVADSASTYGTLATLGGITLNGVLFSDDVAGVSSLSIAARSSAGTYADSVGGLTGAAASNYSLASSGNTDGVLTISAKALTFGVTSQTQVYGSSATLITLNGVESGDDIAIADTLGGTFYFDGTGWASNYRAHVGSHSYTLQGLSGAESGNYSIDFAGATVGLTVTPKPLTYSFGIIGRTYGDTGPIYGNLTGIVDSDDVLIEGVGLQGGVAPAKQNAGSYVLAATVLTGSAASDYSLATTGNTDGALTVTRRTVTWAIGAASSIYGDTAVLGAVTFGGSDGGMVGGDDLVGVISVAGLTTRSNVGSYSQTLSGIGGADAGNYTLSSTGNTAAGLTISARPLTYVIGAASQTYGAVTGGTITLGGALSGDDVSGLAGVLVSGSPVLTPARLGVGSYGQTLFSLTGAKSSNYSIATSGNTAGALTVTPKALTGTVTPSTYIYGSPTGLLSLSGILSGDTVTPTATLDGTLATVSAIGSAYGFDAHASAGSHTAAMTGLAGASAANYSLANTGVSGALTITPKTLTYITANATSTYGDLATPSAPVLGGVLSGDVVSGQLGLSLGGSGVTFNARTAAGTYDILATGLTGAQAANYSLASSGNTTGHLLINPRPLTYVIANASSVYGTLATGGAVTLSNALSGDDVSGVLVFSQSGSPVTLAYNTAAGTYVQSLSGLTGGQGANYVLASSGNSNGLLTIDPKTLTYSLTGASRIYGTAGGGPNASLTGVLAGDSVDTVLAINGGGTLTAHTDVGDYVVGVSGLSGASSANYQLGGTTGPTLAGVTITAKPLTYVLADAYSTYGDLAVLGVATLNGVVSGDSVSATVTLANGVTLNDRLHAGAYGETVTGLTGADVGNYTLALTGNTDGSLFVDRRTVSVGYLGTVSYVYGSPASILTLGNVLAGDEVIPTIDGGRGTVTLNNRGGNLWGASAGGLKVSPFIRAYVNGLTGASAGDYTVNVTNAQFTRVIVTPKPVNILFDGQNSRVYGDGVGATFSISGVLAGDVVSPFLSGSLASHLLNLGGGQYGFDTNLHAGAYAYTVNSIGTGGDGFNYMLSTAQSNFSGALVITPRPVHYTLALNAPGDPTGAVSAVFGSTLADAPVKVTSVTNIVPGDPIPQIIVYGTATNSSGNRTPGVYTIAGSGLLGELPGDYMLATSGNSDITLTVTNATLKVLGYTGVASTTYGSSYTMPSLLVDNDYANHTVFALPYLQINGSPTLLGDRTSAGSYSIVFNGFGGPNASYYTADLSDYVPATFTVNQRSLTTELTHINRTYGDPFSLRAPTISGVLDGDVVNISDILLYTPNGFNLGTQVVLNARTPIGNYLLSAQLGGASAGNYRLANTTNFGGGPTAFGVVEIAPRVVGITVNQNSLTPTYGETPHPLTFTNILSADDVIVPILVSNSAVSQRDINSFRLPAGAYRIVISGLQGADASNYIIPTAGAISLSTGFTVLPKPVTYVVDGAVTTYGTTTGVTGQLSGVLSGETVNFLTTAYDLAGVATPETEYTAAGSYFRRVTSLSSANYVIATSGNLAGGLTINRKPLDLVLTAGSTTRTYGDLTVAASLDGILANDDVGLTGSVDGAAFARLADLNTSGMTRTFSFAAKTGAGSHLTIIGGLTGARAANYSLVTPANSAGLTVAPKSLLYAVADATGRYGGTFDCNPGFPLCNPLATGFQPGAVSFVGVLAGDSVGGSVSLIDFDGKTFSYTPGLLPGTYFEVVSGLTGTSAANYVVAPTGSRPGVLTIKKKWVTWATSNQVNIYGSSPLGVGGQVTALNGIFGDDKITPVVILAASNGSTPVDASKPLTSDDYTFPVVAFVGEDAALYDPWPAGNDWGRYNSLGRLTLLPPSLGLNYTATLPTYVAPPVTTTPVSTDPNIRTVAGIPTLFANPFARGDGVTTGTESAAGAGSTSAGAAGTASGSETQSTGNEDLALSAQEYATVTALAKAGVTGVTISFDESSGVDVRLQSGPGYVQVGVEQKAGGSFEIKLLSTTPHIEMGANVSVEAYVQGGANGSLGAVGDGYVDATTGVLMFAKTESEIGYKDGHVTTEFKNAAGVTYTAGVAGGISGSTGSIDGGATIYAPGVFGEQFKADGGYSDGVVSVNLNIGLEIGIVGFEFNLGFSLDVSPLTDFFGCLFSSCSPPPPPTPRQITDGVAGYNKISQANELYGYMSAHPEYLKGYKVDENFTYTFPADAIRWYYNYQQLMTDSQKMVTQQKQFNDAVQALERQGNPQAAADYITRNLANVRREQTSTLALAERMGMKLAVQNGQLALAPK